MTKETDPWLLMGRAKEGESEAFSQLYELYFVPVFRYIFFRVQQKEVAEDLTQTVFLKAYKAVERFPTEGQSPLAYFFAIAKNTVIDYYRKKKDIPEDPERFTRREDTKDTHMTNVEFRIDGERCLQAVKQLKSDQQEVIVLRFINEMTTAEIAEILGKNEDAVRQLQCRALKTLRISLQ